MGKHYISATGNSRDQKSNHNRLGIVLQIQTRVDIKIVLSTTQTPLVQRGDHVDAELRFWHLDTIKGTRKNDTIDSTQNASPHRPNKEKIQTENSAQQERRRRRRQKCKTTEAQTKKLQRVAVQTQIATKTATFSSRKTPMKRLTQAKWKKKIGLNTWKEAQLQQWKRMNAAKIPSWIETHRRMKWRLGQMRIASLPDERLSTMHKTYRPVGRPKKRWEDEINENDFLKPEENEETKGNEIKNYDTWIKVGKIRKEMESRIRKDSSHSIR